MWQMTTNVVIFLLILRINYVGDKECDKCQGMWKITRNMINDKEGSK